MLFPFLMTQSRKMEVTYLYVDGENHFIRARDAWKAIHGQYAELEAMKDDQSTGEFRRWPTSSPTMPRLMFDTKAKFFWDATLLNRLFLGKNFFTVPSRSVYFTSFTGAPQDLHQAKVFIHECGFEPYVIHEEAKLEKQRDQLAEKAGIRKSAKGVDIGLAVRILEDASRGNFDYCIIVTSDIDFLPLIEAVRRMGKRVTVLGYKAGMGKQSPFEYVPDEFIDIGEQWMRTQYILDHAKHTPPATRRIGCFLVDPAAKDVRFKMEEEQKRCLEIVKKMTGKIAADAPYVGVDTSLATEGIAIDPMKLAALQKAAAGLETAATVFIDCNKNLMA
jgi:hypothetical protein